MYHLDMKKREIETRERRRETLICTVKVDEIRAPLCHTDSTRWALQQSRVNHINVKTQWSKSFVQFWKVQFMLLFSCVALRIKEAFFFYIFWITCPCISYIHQMPPIWSFWICLSIFQGKGRLLIIIMLKFRWLLSLVYSRKLFNEITAGLFLDGIFCSFI